MTISEQEIEISRRWIEEARALMDRVVDPEDKKKIADLVSAAEDLLEATVNVDIENNYDKKLEAFLKAIRESQDIQTKYSLFLGEKITMIFSFLIANALKLIYYDLKNMRALSYFQPTKKLSSEFDLNALETMLSKDQGKKVLKDFLDDKTIAPESYFKQEGKKTLGMTAGYVATRKFDADGTPFMIKVASKSGKTRNFSVDTLCFVNEFVTAPLYKRSMYDRAPIITGVENRKEGKISFRSKFLHDFQLVHEFDDDKRNPPIREVKGAEKLFASILAWGETDYHSGNIGIMKVQDEEGDGFVFAKIDHGFSGFNFFTNPGDLLANFIGRYKRYSYEDKIQLNVNRLKEAIDQITLISDDEIETLIGSRVYQLKSMGFDIKNLTFRMFKDGKFHSKSFQNFDELERHYIKNFKAQMRVMRQLSERLDIISKINIDSTLGMQELWTNGKWLQGVGEKDPIRYAIDNGKKIEKKDPIEYAIENEKEIEEKDPLVWAEENNKKICGLTVKKYKESRQRDVLLKL